MKEQHIKWASQHDWYLGHGVDANNHLFIRAVERYSDGTGSSSIDFTDFQTLREWAGY